MKTLDKIVHTLAQAGVIGLIFASATVFAHDGCERSQNRKAHFMEMAQKHLNQLHDKLTLSDSQAAAWNTFVEKTQPTDVPVGHDVMELRKLPAPERLDHMLSLMQARERHLELLSASVKELYTHLNPEQQKVFDEEFQRKERMSRWH